MPKTKISEYSTTNADNTDIESINIAEGCAPSGINNAIRELMVHLKEFQTGASGDGFTFAGGTLMTGTNTLSGTNVLSGSTTAAFAAGTVSAPSIFASGDTNTGIFFPAADTIAFAEGGAEAMRIDSSGNVGIGTTSPQVQLWRTGATLTVQGTTAGNIEVGSSRADGAGASVGAVEWAWTTQDSTHKHLALIEVDSEGATAGQRGGAMKFYTKPNGTASPAERMRIDSSGNVLINASTNPTGTKVVIGNTGAGNALTLGDIATPANQTGLYLRSTSENRIGYDASGGLTFVGTSTERARITSGGAFLVGTTTESPAVNNVAGATFRAIGIGEVSADGNPALFVNRKTSDGTLVSFRQDGTEEGTISVSGATVSYNGFSGGHWTQLQQGRGYNPEIPRGTVMSSIGEMAEWKSVVWDEVIEHPAVLAVEAVEGKEAVLDEEGNVIEPAVQAVAGVEGKDAWTETINKREAYLGNLAVGATFTEDGFTKTVVDDGNERLPKVKISDVVGDKAVYGVFQTYDEVQDMLITSLGAFVVRIASGVTVQIGDLLESNGDGCAKVQDDDVIRSKTIGKVTSTVKTATYADGSYTVPCVLYCG